MFRKICAAAVFCLFLSAASGAHAEEHIKLGILPVIDTLPLQVASAEGFFAEEGLAVELLPFASAIERDTAMRSGQLDGIYCDMLNVLLLVQGGVEMRIVTRTWDTKPGRRMFAVVAAPDKSPEGTLSVGISRATIIEYLLDGMRPQATEKSVGFDIVEVKKIPIRMQMLLSGQIDSALLPEPLVSLAESRGATVLATDEELAMPLAVIALHESRMPRRASFLRAYDKAVKAIAADPEKYRDLMVRTCRIPPVLAGDFPVYINPVHAVPSAESVEAVQEWMLSRKLLREPLPYDTVVAR